MAACLKHVLRLNGLKLGHVGTWSPKLSLSTLTCQNVGRVINPKHFYACRSSSRLFQRPHIIFASQSLYNSTEATASISSTGATDTLSNSLPPGYIPEPPPLPTPSEEVLNSLGEPAFTSLGLGGYAPSGWIQSGLEALHVGLDLPWWGAIVAGTIVVRLCMFPIVVLAQRNAAHMSNHMPTITRLQQQFSEARMSGNPMEASRLGNELMNYMKRYQIKPFRNFLVPLAQMPVFVSVFVGLRGMANLPVESMTSGGIFWFTDLTVTDPYYALPLLTVSTLLATIELGVDGVKTGTMSHNMKWIFRAMPVILFPVISGFPTAMLCYWFTSNAFSLLQVMFLKIPVIRDKLNIPQLIKHDATMMPKKKGFLQGFKESWNNAKVASEMEQRQRVDSLKFKEAGLGPIQKTYATNPKVMLAKKK